MLIGLSIAFGLCFFAFEWRTYEETKSDNWVYLEDVIDTLQPPKVIPIPTRKIKAVPKLKPTSNIIEIVKLDFEQLELDEKKNKHTDKSEEANPLEDGLWEDGDDTEDLVPLGFKLPLKNPDTRPFFQSEGCLNNESNFDRYRYTIQKVQRQIQNRLYRPDMLLNQLEFDIAFKIDTTGRVIDVNVIGTDNQNIINSARNIIYKLPVMAPAYHKGEKRVMETKIPVRIIY